MKLRNALEVLESIKYKELKEENLVQSIKIRGKIEGIEFALALLKDDSVVVSRF